MIQKIDAIVCRDFSSIQIVQKEVLVIEAALKLIIPIAIMDQCLVLAFVWKVLVGTKPILHVSCLVMEFMTLESTQVTLRFVIVYMLMPFLLRLLVCACQSV